MIDYGFGVILRALDSSWDHKIKDWRNDPRIWKWCGQNNLITDEKQKDWFSKIHNDPYSRFFRIVADVDKEDPTMRCSSRETIGVCSLSDIDFVHRRAEFSIYLGPEFQGHGFSKKALKTLFTYGFLEVGLKSIWGETFETNKAQDIFASIGMKIDGRRRQFYFKEGNFLDAILFSMLDSDFKELKWTSSHKVS